MVSSYVPSTEAIMLKNAATHRDDGIFTQTLAEAASDPSFIDEMVAWYIGVFNAAGPGEWNEHWTPEEVRRKPFLDAANDGSASIVTSWRKDGVLAGLAVVYVGDADTAVTECDLPTGLRERRHLEAVVERLRWFAGGTQVAHFRELGILTAYRSGLGPVVRLLVDPLSRAGDAGAEFSCCWTSKGSRLYPLIKGLDVREIHDFCDPDGHILMGDDVASIVRRLRMPEQVILAMLSRRKS
jgi:hypothetical protein